MSESEPLVGVVGLGRMGRPMAANLVRAGFPTVGFDLDPDVTRAFSAEFGIEDALAGRLRRGRGRHHDASDEQHRRRSTRR